MPRRGAYEGVHRRYDQPEILPAVRLAENVGRRLAAELGVGSEEPRLGRLVSVGVDDQPRRLVPSRSRICASSRGRFCRAIQRATILGSLTPLM